MAEKSSNVFLESIYSYCVIFKFTSGDSPQDEEEPQKPPSARSKNLILKYLIIIEHKLKNGIATFTNF